MGKKKKERRNENKFGKRKDINVAQHLLLIAYRFKSQTIKCKKFLTNHNAVVMLREGVREWDER